MLLISPPGSPPRSPRSARSPSTLAWASFESTHAARSGTSVSETRSAMPLSSKAFASRLYFPMASICNSAKRLVERFSNTRQLEQEKYQSTNKSDFSSPYLDILLFSHDVPSFECDDSAMVEYLHRYGYVVVRSVLKPADVEQAMSSLWDFMESEAGWCESDPNSWTDESMQTLGCPKTGILNGHGVGQSELSWLMRTRPRTLRAFASVWGTNDLITSFDGICLFRPWHHYPEHRRTSGGWYHVDQGRTKSGFACVQGLVSLLDANNHTGGLTVIPGSHQRFLDELVPMMTGDRDYFRIPEGSSLLDEPRLLVKCSAGDLILWDSRTAHCSAPATDWPVSLPSRLLRVAGYVCMVPKTFADKEVLTSRRLAYENKVTTTHWPHMYIKGAKWHAGGKLDFEAAEPVRRRLIC